MGNKLHSDVLVIGAGPSGAVAAALLKQQGFSVIVLEKEHFPRFSIGESLLPQCMEFIEQAGMLDAVKAAGFQLKNGAAFNWRERYTDFNFSDKISPGWGTTYQVERASFDKVLADCAASQGVDIYYDRTIEQVAFDDDGCTVHARNSSGETFVCTGRFLLDASGFGRVLPRLLDLDRPSSFPSRRSLFTHVEDCIDSPDFDRDKILITVHPDRRDVWYWLIPFANGRSSVGVVAEDAFFAEFEGDDQGILCDLIHQDPVLSRHLKQARYDTPVNTIVGYSANVSRLWGPRFALLGNAGEFLDPVFSSGVTIAMKSAKLAAEALTRELRGEPVDWEADYSQPLQCGVDTFRAFVEMWYEGKLQDIFFYPGADRILRAQICSILAGYAWDNKNPFVRSSRGRLDVLAKVCREAMV
ncbi:NAD(P)/FAD-dependent oxidoreductase [Porticoccus sp. W117]|uniref:NAD(P)/FAD-dependent oxidoreductase n=1 Tax=Porticoccus sp. W117 TaxID=3054777 RepID=UPI00259A496C|nr:NAD(P)/FAD-dependent oxidoreductase [Porticoccus sp. W117]MDM3869848.1 NAD(P)/FAD-dependent oxidoreductase [Porticoccus sp. W117]